MVEQEAAYDGATKDECGDGTIRSVQEVADLESRGAAGDWSVKRRTRLLRML